MHRLGSILILLGMLHITGLDLAIAQVYAWSTMMHERYDKGVLDAMSSTFSGSNPCEKCIALKKEREKRKTTKTISSEYEKFKHSLPCFKTLVRTPWQPLTTQLFLERPLFYDSIVLELPHPPPKGTVS